MITPQEDAGLYALDAIEKSIQTISARTFLGLEEVKALMTAMAYQRDMTLTPHPAIGAAIQSITQMMEALVKKNKPDAPRGTGFNDHGLLIAATQDEGKISPPPYMPRFDGARP